MLKPIAVALFSAVVFSSAFASAAAPTGYQPKVNVSTATRLDWVFAVANQSPATPPASFTAGYDSTAQQYELFVPPSVNPSRPLPLVLFISAGENPAGWAQWQVLCKQAGVVFASPLGAGNNCPGPRRAHIVLDVLDDVARKYPIDPDRTYLAGFSGGARMACNIAFALPEYFGGVIAVCGAEKLREESYLRQRVVDRLSVALVTGEQDFNRSELERFREPLLTGVGVRTKVWTAGALAHAIPDIRVLGPALKWLEEGLPDRQKQARAWPAMRIGGKSVGGRDDWAAALVKEARLRIAKPATLYSGLMQLQGVNVRWPDTPAAEEAIKLLTDFEGRTERPWEKEDLEEQRRFLIAEARGLDSYGSGPLPPQYEKQRADMLGGAIQRWQQVLADDPDGPAGKEAAKRLPELEKLLSKAEK